MDPVGTEDGADTRVGTMEDIMVATFEDTMAGVITGGYYRGYYPHWYSSFYWGFPILGWPYVGWPYAFYGGSPYVGWPYYPSGMTEAPPADSEPAQPQPYYWYYCQDPQGYYPYVKSCPGGWIEVVPKATPPSQ